MKVSACIILFAKHRLRSGQFGCARGAIRAFDSFATIDLFSVAQLVKLEAVLGVDLYSPNIAEESAERDAQICGVIANTADGASLDELCARFRMAPNDVLEAAVRIRRRLASHGLSIVEPDGRMRIGPAIAVASKSTTTEPLVVDDCTDDELAIILDLWAARCIVVARRFSSYDPDIRSDLASLAARGAVVLMGERVELCEQLLVSLEPLEAVRIPYREIQFRLGS